MKQFKSQKDNKSALDSGAVGGGAATSAHTKTSEDEWQNHQRPVSRDSENLYSVTDNPSETAMTGDGYSVTNGTMNFAMSGGLNDFFEQDSGAEETVGKKLKTVEHEAPGLVTSAGTAPSVDELVSVDPDGTFVKKYEGTVDSPNVQNDVSDKYLFTDAGPSQDDIRQYGVGDCYFWAAVLQILANDPAKFPAMMKLNGKTVETTMYHKKGFKWVECKISRPIGIGGLNCQYAEKDFEGLECGVRLDTGTPCESAWNAVIEGENCRINRTDFYKAALWANCLEQAYSDFSRLYGKYGSGAQEKKNSGNEEFEYGRPDKCLNMFYGGDVKSSNIMSASNGFLNIGRTNVLNTLIDFKKTLNRTGSFSTVECRRTSGDPSTNSAHIYSIQNVTFKDGDGNIIDVSSGKVKHSSIDTSQSTLLIRNPWGSNGAEGKLFEITIDELLNNSEWTHVYRNTISGRTSEE